MNAAPRVLIADDHAPTRAGVRLSLEAGGFVLCAEAEDAAGAIEGAVREGPDLCLLDINMPGSGIAAASEISRHLPSARIVMLTVSVKEDDLFAAIRAGATGYLLKDTNPERLPLALRGVLNGEAALPRSLVARIIDEFREREAGSAPPREPEPAPGELTPREWRVLQLMRDGLTTAEMSAELSISPVTVRRHVSQVLHKLRVPDREAAVRMLEDRETG